MKKSALPLTLFIESAKLTEIDEFGFNLSYSY